MRNTGFHMVQDFTEMCLRAGFDYFCFFSRKIEKKYTTVPYRIYINLSRGKTKNIKRKYTNPKK